MSRGRSNLAGSVRKLARSVVVGPSQGRHRGRVSRRCFSLRNVCGVLLAAVASCAPREVPLREVSLSLCRSPAEGGIQIATGYTRTDEGPILCSLYASAEGFPGEVDHAVARDSVEPSSGGACCVFKTAS